MTGPEEVVAADRTLLLTATEAWALQRVLEAASVPAVLGEQLGQLLGVIEDRLKDGRPSIERTAALLEAAAEELRRIPPRFRRARTAPLLMPAELEKEAQFLRSAYACGVIEFASLRP